MKRFLLALVGCVLLTASWVDVADAQWFGRNKVQYRSFDFKVIRTEHFDIYFYEDAREAAMDAARMAERSYARLSRILQHEFRERKPIILYASHTDFQQTNVLPMFIDESTGGVAEPLKNRIIMPFTGSYADFEHVLTHELVHAFQFDVIYRRGGLADGSPFGARPPLWFMEGMAEYLAIGEIDANTQAWLRDGALSGYLRNIQEMTRRDDFLSYRFGQSLWAYIGSKWGDEVIGILLQKSPRVGIERAFHSTLGLTLGELSQEWMASVRSTYLPQLTDFQRPEHFGERLTAHRRPGDASYLAPAISPDGNLMALISQRDGFFPDLYLANARTGEIVQRLVETAKDADFETLRFITASASFSPDGRFLAFTSQSGGREVLHLYDLERNRVDRTLRFPLNGVRNPSWSPDGREIVFSGLDGGLTDLYITDLRGNLRRLTSDRHAALVPSWSPDGRAIAFTTDRGDGTDFDRLVLGNLRVALYHLDDGSIELLPHQDEGKNFNPVWAPDARSLVWVSDRTGTNNLYLFDFADGGLYRVSDVLSGVVSLTTLSPALSWAQRDGRLLFVYFEEAGYNIYAVSDPRELPRTPVVSEPTPRLVADAGTGTAPEPDVEAEDARALPDGPVTSFYKEGSTFRPSAELPELLERAGPVSIRALLDSADLALPDTADFEIRDYRPRLSPDMVGRPTVGAQVGGHYGNGLYGGSFISMSDILGNHNLLLAGNVSGSFSDAMFFGGYSYLKNRTNYGVAFQQVPLYRYWGRSFVPVPVGDEVLTGLADIYFRDVYRTGQLLMSYPFSVFRRVELGLTAASFKRDVLFRGIMEDGRPLRRDDRIFDMQFLEPNVSLVFDNSLFGWTGPIVGRRYRAQLSHPVGDVRYTEGMLDFRNYMNFRQRIVLATRLLGLVRHGPDADAFPMFWGGPYFLRGYDGGTFRPSSTECARSYTGVDGDPASVCPVMEQLIGSSAAIVNMELRFPIITELQIGLLGQFPPVDAVLFFDGGLAWLDQFCPGSPSFGCREAPVSRDVRVTWRRGDGEDPTLVREPLFSYGAGLRINIFYTVLRLDYAFPISRPDRRSVFSLSFGPSF